MNYRHAFHAGNHADVLKHVILLACLDHLKKKPAPFVVLDTHAGPGRYDLTGAEAQRSPEWQAGAARVFDWPDAPAAFAPYRAALADANADGALRSYPGSPVLIRAALRAQDRLIACELHEDDSRALRRLFRADAQAQIHHRDGWAALGALLPPPERRGLVLIDPPYEQDGELARAAGATAAALARFRGGVFIWWRPLKAKAAVDVADAEFRARIESLPAPPHWLRADLAIAAPEDGGLTASSVLIINPPYGLSDLLNAIVPALAARLARGAGGFGRVEGRREA